MTSRLDRAVELLERSLAHARVVLHDLETAVSSRPGLLQSPTPCTAWDLEALLAHLADSLDAFTEAAGGRVLLDPAHTAEGRHATSPCAAWLPPGEPVAQVRDVRRRADRLLAAWIPRPRTGPGDPGDPGDPGGAAVRERPDGAGGAASGAGTVAVADRSLDAATVAAAAALEVGVHAWDLARAAGLERPLPDALAADLLPVAHACVGPWDRGPRFAAALPAPGRPATRAGGPPGTRPVDRPEDRSEDRSDAVSDAAGGRRAGPAAVALLGHLGRDLTGPVRGGSAAGGTNPGEHPPPGRRAS